MKRLLALLLAVLTVMSLLAGCGKDNETVPDDPAVEDGETLPVDNDPAGDPYDAVKTYWSEAQLTQAWGPDQVVEHLFFHPIIAFPQWAFHECGASESQRCLCRCFSSWFPL